MSVGLSNMEATGHSDMHKILARVDFRGAPLQRVTRMRWEPVGTQRKTLRGEKSQHVCMNVTAIQQQRQWSWEQKRDIKMFLEVRFITVTCKISNEFSSCSNGGVLLFHVQWL